MPLADFAEMDQVCEPERVIETLQLFPLNSFGESESERWSRAHASDQCRENHVFSYKLGEQMDQPPLDLRLNFV